MSINRLGKVFLVFILLFHFAGCGTTKHIGTWKDPSFSISKYRHAIVIGIAARDSNRRIFEDEFVKQLQEKNFNAIPSYPLFTLGEINDNKDAIIAQLAQKGIDSVIVTRMVDKTTEQKYYPPTVSYTGPPRAYYGGWYGYYGMGYSHVSSPGYSKTYDVVKLECNVYDLEKEELVFSGLSQTTISRGNERKLAGSIVKALVKSMFSK